MVVRVIPKSVLNESPDDSLMSTHETGSLTCKDRLKPPFTIKPAGSFVGRHGGARSLLVTVRLGACARLMRGTH